MGDAHSKTPRVDELVDALRGDGDGEAGEFTVDTEAAKQKLAGFTLKEPRSFVLLLVRAAIRRGAASIHFDIAPSEIIMTCEGACFTARELEQRFAEALDPSARERRPGLRELTLGLLAARRAGYRHVSLKSRCPEGGANLIMDANGEGVAKAEPGETFTRIEVADRGAPAHRERYALEQRFGRETQLEEALLRDHCRYADTLIAVNGVPIADRFDRFELALGRTRIRAHGQEGKAGFFPHGDGTGELVLLVDGVVVERRARPSWEHGFTAVVEPAGLQLDASESRAVQNPALEDAEDAAHRAYRRQRKTLQMRDVERWQQDLSDTRGWLRTTLRKAESRLAVVHLGTALQWLVATVILVVVGINTAKSHSWWSATRIGITLIILTGAVGIAALGVRILARWRRQTLEDRLCRRLDHKYPPRTRAQDLLFETFAGSAGRHWFPLAARVMAELARRHHRALPAPRKPTS